MPGGQKPHRVGGRIPSRRGLVLAALPTLNFHRVGIPMVPVQKSHRELRRWLRSMWEFWTPAMSLPSPSNAFNALAFNVMRVTCACFCLLRNDSLPATRHARRFSRSQKIEGRSRRPPVAFSNPSPCVSDPGSARSRRSPAGPCSTHHRAGPGEPKCSHAAAGPTRRTRNRARNRARPDSGAECSRHAPSGVLPYPLLHGFAPVLRVLAFGFVAILPVFPLGFAAVLFILALRFAALLLVLVPVLSAIIGAGGTRDGHRQRAGNQKTFHRSFSRGGNGRTVGRSP